MTKKIEKALSAEEGLEAQEAQEAADEELRAAKSKDMA